MVMMFRESFSFHRVHFHHSLPVAYHIKAMPPSKPPPPRRNRPAGTSDPSSASSASSSSSDKPATSSAASASQPSTNVRLGSLSSRSKPGGSTIKRSFVPKQVVRRSVAEREKTAPAASKVQIIPVTKPQLDPRNKGKGAGRRRGGRFDPIATQAVGAFSAIGAADMSRRRGPAIELRGSATNSSSTLSANIKDGGMEDGFDMTRSVGIDTEEFFPIRPVRDEVNYAEDDTKLDPENLDDLDYSDTEVEIKNEQGEMIRTRVKSTTPFELPQKKQDVYVSPEELTELKRVAKDHKTIAKEFSIARAQSATSVTLADENEARPEIEQKLFFFQMPVLSPAFKAKEGQEKNEDSDAAVRFPEGRAGKLRVHKSGKLTMMLGNIVMEVSQGTEANFLQDIVVVEPELQKVHLIGQVTRKMIVSPDIDILLEGVKNL